MVDVKDSTVNLAIGATAGAALTTGIEFAKDRLNLANVVSIGKRTSFFNPDPENIQEQIIDRLKDKGLKVRDFPGEVFSCVTAEYKGRSTIFSNVNSWITGLFQGKTFGVEFLIRDGELKEQKLLSSPALKKVAGKGALIGAAVALVATAVNSEPVKGWWKQHKPW